MFAHRKRRDKFVKLLGSFAWWQSPTTISTHESLWDWGMNTEYRILYRHLLALIMHRFASTMAFGFWLLSWHFGNVYALFFRPPFCIISKLCVHSKLYHLLHSICLSPAFNSLEGFSSVSSICSFNFTPSRPPPYLYLCGPQPWHIPMTALSSPKLLETAI